jgi:hypothetical protein
MLSPWIKIADSGHERSTVFRDFNPNVMGV